VQEVDFRKALLYMGLFFIAIHRLQIYCCMNDIKTFFAFRDGEIAGPEKYDWDMSIAATVETIKCFLAALIEKYRLSGKVLIEIKDGFHFVDYDVMPKEYEQQLKQELNKRCFVFEREEFSE
jgi:hypothetical protein